MDWFDPADDAVIRPEANRARSWRRKYGTEKIEVSPRTIFANNGHGRLFDAVCGVLDRYAEPVHDHRTGGYCYYRAPSSGNITVYRASEPAPYAAADLEHLISAGAREILFLNGTGSLRPDVPVGTVLLPGELIREEGTSFHYAPPDTVLSTSERLNRRIRGVAGTLGVGLVEGSHWTTDAIYRETFSKVKRYRGQGIVSVEMELSALATVAHYRRCELAALLVVTDVLTERHTWDGMASEVFRRGVEQAARIAAGLFLE